MNFERLADPIADAVNPLLAIGLVFWIVRSRRAESWPLLFGGLLAFVLCQQAAKWAQRARWVSDSFPSTHFAVALCLATLWIAFERRSAPFIALLVLGYGALMLAQRYHTPLEMLGSIYAIPLTLLITEFVRRVARTRAPVSQTSIS